MDSFCRRFRRSPSELRKRGFLVSNQSSAERKLLFVLLYSSFGITHWRHAQLFFYFSFDTVATRQLRLELGR